MLRFHCEYVWFHRSYEPRKNEIFVVGKVQANIFISFDCISKQVAWIHKGNLQWAWTKLKSTWKPFKLINKLVLIKLIKNKNKSYVISNKITVSIFLLIIPALLLFLINLNNNGRISISCRAISRLKYNLFLILWFV